MSAIYRLDRLESTRLLAGIQIGFESINSQLHISEGFAEKRAQKSGAPGGIRTPDLQLRRLPLYPSELQARDSSLLQVSAGEKGQGNNTIDTTVRPVGQ